MIKDYYIVDCENVGLSHIKLSERVDVGIDYVTSILKKKFITNKYGNLVYIKHNQMKDALDFCVATQLGYAIATYGHNIAYHIVSKDRGFDNIVDYWLERIMMLIE